MKYIEVINLDKYQTYRGRNPLWAKVYIKMFDDERIRQLFDGERWLFVALVLLAIGMENAVPMDVQWIYNRVSYRSRGRGANAVRMGCKKLLKLKLIRLKGHNIEKKREDKIREEDISSFNKPTYRGMEMRKVKGKWFCLPPDGSSWLIFAGKEKEIEYK